MRKEPEPKGVTLLILFLLALAYVITLIYTLEQKASKTMASKTKEQAIEEIANDICGTCKSVEYYVDWYWDEYGLELTGDEIEDGVMDYSVERCNGCGWWSESHEFVTPDLEQKHCDSCDPPSNYED